jgi:prepilin-type N-terminal cleavage/methylation domain-containing protein
MTLIRNRQRGFTLIELLIVVAIIGIIAALLIPNFLDALQKAKQKRTVADERNAGTAWFSWLTDQYGAAAAAGAGTYVLPATVTYAELTGTDKKVAIQPQYIQNLPENDGWKTAYVWHRQPTTNLLATNVMAIVSYGRNKTVNLGTGTITVGEFTPTDYDQDIVWADGYFVRWPSGAGVAT